MSQSRNAWRVSMPRPVPIYGHVAGAVQGYLALVKGQFTQACKTWSASYPEIHAGGVDLFLHQQGIDTTSPGGKAKFQMLGVFAEFERSIIQERVRAGLRRAKAEGKQLGRPRIAPELEAKNRSRPEGARA